MRPILFILAASIVSGCVTAEADLQRATGICEAGGLVAGTPQFQACVSQEAANLQESRMATSAAIGNAMQGYSQAYTQNMNAMAVQRPAYAPMNCTSNTLGGYTRTSCY